MTPTASSTSPSAKTIAAWGEREFTRGLAVIEERIRQAAMKRERKAERNRQLAAGSVA